MRRRIVYPVCALLALACLAAPPWHEVPVSADPGFAPPGRPRSTAAEAVRWTEDTAALLLPGAPVARVSAEPHDIGGRGRVVQRRWETALWDSADACLAEYVWDANSGDLLSYQRGPGADGGMHAPAISSARDAVEASRHWMLVLGHGRAPGRRPVLDGARGSPGGTWRVRWTVGGRPVTVTVDPVGDLSTLTDRRLLRPDA